MKWFYRLALSALFLLHLPAVCRAEKYALLIGLDKYGYSAARLDGSISDVRGVADALQKNCGYRLENIQVLAGDGKTKLKRREILDVVAHFAERIKPDDTIFFFWSGHGANMGGQDRVQTYDSNVWALNHAQRTLLPVQEMLAPLLHIRSKALMVFFDMCRSVEGPISDKKITPAAASVSAQQDATTVDGMAPQQKFSLYSSEEGQNSYTWPAKHRSMFGYYLEQGLRGAAADASGEIHAENLIGYVQKAVLGQCKWQFGVLQRPSAITSGPEALHLMLASGFPPGNGGATAVPAVVDDSADARFEAAFMRGAELRDQRSYEEARIKYEEAVHIKPEDYVVNRDLAAINYHLNRYDDAERYIRKALTIQPKNAGPIAVLGNIAYVRKDYVLAEKLYRQAMKMNSTYASPICSLGYLYQYIKHDDKEALALYEKAARVDTSDPNPLYDQGCLYERRKDYTQAENIYRKLMEIHPDFAPAVSKLAWIADKIKKDIPEAEKLYLKAIELDPRTSWVQDNLGWLYFQNKKDLVEAEKRFNKAIELDPTNNDAISDLAYLYYQRKDYHAAEERCRTVLDRDPKHAGTLCVMGVLQYARANFVEAEKMFRLAQESDPKYWRPSNGLAKVFFQRKDYAEAEKFYHQALENDPDNAVPTNGLADVCCAREDYAAAEKLYRKAIELDPTEGQYHANLAGCLLKEKQREAAMMEAKKAIELGFKDPCDAYTALNLNPP